MNRNVRTASHGIPDSEFERGNVPMTKAEVRAVTLSKLQLKTSDCLVDLGAGTGSVSIEAALVLTEGRVIAVERKSEAVALLRRNREKFECENLEIIESEAPTGLEAISHVQKVMIGGSGGHLTELVRWAARVLEVDGRIAMNMITLENVHAGWEALKSCGFDELEIVQVMISKGKQIGDYTMMMGQNPVYILSARKGQGNWQNAME